jgi:2-polyprenyl-6-methoxyphenol hydroxylase-like FAD-dependent oxidoreductase
LTDYAVVIAGGGPTGLMLAGELSLAGVDVVVVEPRATQELDGSRAGGLHSRTLEVLDQRGIGDRFVAEGQAYPSVRYAQTSLDISDFPTRHNYVLGLWQPHIERILLGWVSELGVPILRSRAVTGFVPGESHIDVELSDGSALQAQYLVGCDGGRSLVRKAAGIGFPGLAASTSWIRAEVEMDEEPEFGIRRNSVGQHAIGRRKADEPIGIVLTERSVEHAGAPSLDELREALIGVYGTDFGLRSASSISRFTDAARQAAAYRDGRVLLAGDAAHVHPPQGGQGLNIGVQDAVNLGWKLAQVVHGTSADGLLDTYHAERHPVGATVLQSTIAQVALSRPDERHQALRNTMGELLAMDEPRRRIVAMLAGLDVRYDLGEGHPLIGRRMPDLDLQTTDGPTRASTLLHEARPVLLDLAGPGASDPSPRSGGVRRVDARHDGVWELPVVGEVPAPSAVLIRPDGYVAWAGEPTDPALPAALSTWFGGRSAGLPLGR